jgi:alpha-2-macroglobulin
MLHRSHYARSAGIAVFAITLSGLALSGPTAAQQSLPAAKLTAVPVFAPANVKQDATRYEATLKATYKPGKKSARELINEAAVRPGQSVDPRAQSRILAQAVVADPNDAIAWQALANALLATTPEADKGSERYELPMNGGASAWIAYTRSTNDAQKATALATLHEAFKRRNQWRPAIETLKFSLALIADPKIRVAYDALVAEHGFRVVDYKTDSDTAQPRVCIQFSERLSSSETNWTHFIRVDGRDPQSVTAEGRHVCIDGLGHGKRYQVQVRQGLPSNIGENILKTSDLNIYVKDRTPSVRTSGRSYVLPRTGQQGLPLVSINTDVLAVEVYRVGDRGLTQALQTGEFQRLMSSDDFEQVKDRLGAKVYTGELAVQNKLNADVTTAFPVTEAISNLQPGVYAISARVPTKGDADQSRRANQWFIVSDLGVSVFTGDDGMHAFVRSLASASSVANATVRLVAKNNEILGTTKTDAKGYARFDAALRKGEGGLAPAFISAETTDADYAFLDMTTAAFDLTDRGVKGREAPGPVDGFLYGDRGVYRPGETVNLTALIRDRNAKALNVPVTMIVSRPDGVEHRRIALLDDAASNNLGGRTSALVLGANAMTGTWRAKVYTDTKGSSLAQFAFLVEDFVPERLDLTLEPGTVAIAVDGGGKVNVSGRYLYGPPAAGLALEGEIVVKPSAKGLAQFPGYVFGLSDEKIAAVRKPIDGLSQTGADGKVVVQITLPAIERTARPLDADVILKLRESGGRSIERVITLPVDHKIVRVGIKPQSKGVDVREGDKSEFQLILVGTDGRQVSGQNLKWELKRLDTRYQYFMRDGQWAYEAQTATRRVADGIAETYADKPALISAELAWGRYRLEVSAQDGSGAVSNLVFNAGHWADEAADSPEVLDIALDKSAYKPGETARVRVSTRTAGKAQIAVLGSGLAATTDVDVPAGGAEFPIAVSDTWGPGAYVTVSLYRPMDTASKRMPGRALGVHWLAVDQSARTLTVALGVPDKVKSGARLEVPVRIGGLSAGEQARVTLAVVDVGILNLTRFETPKPEGWFNGQRRLAFELRDFYNRLIDGMSAERGKLRSGGDGADPNGMASNGNAPVEATLAQFSGIVKIGTDGLATVPFDLPDFNGTVRLSAVAWSGDKIGSVSKDMLVRDPVTLTVSGPRFLTLGDEARLQFDVHNVEGPESQYKIAVRQGDVALSDTALDLKVGEKKSDQLTIKPSDVGAMTLTVNVSGPNGITVKRSLAFDVKPPAGDIRRVTMSVLKANGGKITLSPDIAHDMIAGRTRINVQVGPMAGLNAAGLLTELDRYPHGCAEQTVSRALPLLYVNDVARQVFAATDTSTRERVQKAIDRVLEMQDSSGAFGIWGPADGDLWLSSYVTDFLTRARETGATVNPVRFALALDRLQNYVATGQDFTKGGEARAYALYVLARAGRAPAGELRYDADTRLDAFATPLAQAQLGAALALIGDKPRSEKAFAAAIKSFDGIDAGLMRRDYGTSLRDGAALVTLASEAKVVGVDMPKLTDVIAKAYASKSYTSTQEQAWMLLAVKSLMDQTAATALTVGGEVRKGQFLRSLKPSELTDSGLVISNDGDVATNAVISVIGAALTTEPAISKGFTLERTYYTLDGKKVELASATGGLSTLKQNDRLVVVLKVAAKNQGGRIILVDRLPAGLEIENPKLVESGDIKTLDWLKVTAKPEHAEFRDDRFVAAFDFSGDNTSRGNRRNRTIESEGDGDAGVDEDATAATATKTTAPALPSATVAYLVRAVTPGLFVHPAATVEDMYRPDRFARTAAGKISVQSK